MTSKLLVYAMLSSLGLIPLAQTQPAPWDMWGQLGALGILGVATGVMMLKVLPEMMQTNREQAETHNRAIAIIAASVDKLADSISDVRVQCALAQAQARAYGSAIGKKSDDIHDP